MDAILARCGGRWPAPPSGHDKYTWDSTGGGFPYGHLTRRASASISSPVTFHHLPVDHLFLYERMRFADSRGPNGEVYATISRPSFQGVHNDLDSIGASIPGALRHRSGGARGRFGERLASVLATSPHAVRRAALKSSTRATTTVRGHDQIEMVVAKVPEANGDGCVAESDDPLRVPLQKQRSSLYNARHVLLRATHSLRQQDLIRSVVWSVQMHALCACGLPYAVHRVRCARHAPPLTCPLHPFGATFVTVLLPSWCAGGVRSHIGHWQRSW